MAQQGRGSKEGGGGTAEEVVEKRGKKKGWKENRCCPSLAPGAPGGAQLLNQRLATTKTTALVHLGAEHKILVRELATNSFRLTNVYKLVGV